MPIIAYLYYDESDLPRAFAYGDESRDADVRVEAARQLEMYRRKKRACQDDLQAEATYTLRRHVLHDDGTSERTPLPRELETPTWQNQLAEAARLPSCELRRHAAVSTHNRHRCAQCFCCAALTVLEGRRAQEPEEK